ncbi:rubrerythrin-like domain-containing protein [Haloarchaeobius sp. DYHT-AS-18]
MTSSAEYECLSCGLRTEDADENECPKCGGELRNVSLPRE